MINLLLGSSGSGKSYECVVYHVLPALASGRKVVTNLPLNLEYFKLIHPEYLDLIELRKKPLPIKGEWNPDNEANAFVVRDEQFWRQRRKEERIFSNVWDFYHEWRHPVDGSGVLFIIDEAQNYIPYKKTAQSVEEWSALHRHWFSDIIIITQSYGKVSEAFRDNVQMVYRFRKMIAWGKPENYIRKVQDGLKGEVLNTTERHYEKQYFPFYRSHTQAKGSGKEHNAQDIVPLWKHWSFKGAALMLVLFLGIIIFGDMKNPLKANIPDKPKFELDQATLDNLDETPSTKFKQVKSEIVKEEKKPKDPLFDKGIHISAHIKSKSKELWLFSISQNGQHVFFMKDTDFIDAGYQYISSSDCLGYLKYNDIQRTISCDAPTQAVKSVI